MNRYFSIAGIAVCLTASVIAQEWKRDVSYYDSGFPQTGNKQYLAERCKLDLRLPSGVKQFPTVVWFHGGGLSAGKKYAPHTFSPDKIAVAAVNYRLSGTKAACPDYIYDAAAATAWVLKHIAEFGGDPKKVYVSGHSAGGYLSAMLALDKRYLETFGASPMQLAGVMPLSGQMTTHFRILAERRAKDPKTPKIFLDEYAPIFVASTNAPPMFFIVGDSKIEWPSRVEENMLLTARMQRIFRHPNIHFYSLSGFDHSSMHGPGVLLANDLILSQCYPKQKKK